MRQHIGFRKTPSRCFDSTNFFCYIIKLLYIIKMNIKTNLLEDDINFVNTTKKKNKQYKEIISLIAIIISLVLSYLFFKYLKEKQFLFITNI